MGQEGAEAEEGIHGEDDPCGGMTLPEGEIGKEAPQEHMNRSEGAPPDAVSKDFGSSVPTANEDEIEPSHDGQKRNGAEYLEETTGVGREVGDGSEYGA